MTFRIAGNFNFLDLVALARKGVFDPSAFQGAITLDMTSAIFVSPDAMACIKALLVKAQKENETTVCFEVQHAGQDSINYLRRMDFFTDDINWCNPVGVGTVTRHDPTGRFVPMRQIFHLRETAPATRDMVECLTTPSNGADQTLRYALSEMADNALQHSESPNGAILTAQRYDKSESVNMLIVDTGIGILRHLRKHPKYQNVVTDAVAVETALKPFVTGTYIPRGSVEIREYHNQGLGLSVVNAIATRSRGTLMVWTGNALYRSTKNSVEQLPVSWPGTVIYLTLPSKVGINPTEIVDGFGVPSNRAPTVLQFR